jgi:POTRA domain, FtsQ-type
MPVLRPARRLPKQFRRPVNSRLHTFVKKRHGTRPRNWHQQLRVRWRRIVLHTSMHLQWLRQYAVLLLSVVAVVVVTIILFSPLLTVREIKVVRQYGRLDADAVQQQLQDLFGRRLLLVSAAAVRQRVETVVPDMNDIVIEKQYPSRLVVHVALQPLVARLKINGSGGTLPLVASGTALAAPSALADFLTDTGMYVQAVDVQSGALLPELRIEDWSVRPKPGTVLLHPDLLRALTEAEAQLETEFGQKTKYRTVYVRGQEYHLSNGRISLWFDGRTPVEPQLQRYRLFLQAVGIKNVQKYIDLRLQGKVVYR